MGQFLPRIIETWRSLSAARKGLLTASGVGLLAVLFAVYVWSSHPAYATLYSGLDTADSGSIVEQLRTQGVKYQLDASGSTIRVPQSQVDDLRVNFASQGMPQGGHVGFEVFNGNSLTATDFVQRLNFQRGLQGELERTLEAFPAVEHARVHVVLPEKSLFKNDQQPATASVVLALRSGRALHDNEVNGMAHLIAGAVEGLAKDHITILDTSGQMVYDGSTQGANNGFGTASSQIGVQAQYEQALEASVQSMLDRALGPAKSAVNVSATLNFDQLETQKEAYAAPASGTPRSTKTVTETYTTGGQAAAGQVPGALANVPGANANLPAGVQPAAAGDTTNYQRNEGTSNFELDKTLTKQVAAAGGVKRLSVSLLLDDSIPEAQATALQQSVGAAVGLDANRGDAIVVTRVPFNHSALDEATKAFQADAAHQQLLSYIRIALPVLMLVIAFVFFRMLIRSVSARTVRAYDRTEGFALASGGLALEASSALHALPPASPEEIRRSELETSVQRMAHSSPESVAEVVQSWLRED